MRVSPFGSLLLVFCIALAFASVLFMNVSWAFAAVAIASAFTYARLRFVEELEAADLEVGRSVLEKMVFAQEAVTVKVEIVNRTETSMRGVVEDLLPEGAELASGMNRFAATLRPQTLESFTYSLRLDKRGPHRIGGLRVEWTDSFGLFTEEQLFGETTLVNAHTKKQGYYSARKLGGREYLEYPGLSRTPAAVIRQQEFSGIREYVPGDRVRDIFWKALPKLGRPITKTYVREAALRTMIFLDCTRSMRIANRGASKMDHAVDLSMQLSSVLISSYHPTGLAIFDEVSVLDETPPGLGKRKFEDIVKVLRNAPPSLLLEEAPTGPAYTPTAAGPTKRTSDAARDSGFLSAVAELRGGRLGLGIDAAIKGLVTHAKGQQQLFVMISDLGSSRDAVLATARLCQHTRNKLLVIHTYGDWYDRPSETPDPARIERIYKGLSSLRDVEAELRATKASYMRIGPADSAAGIVRAIRRGLA